ncbi:MAG: serine/threonine-protein phosphatase [Calditrichae bacterium]|nr:serine/threonine-protein phosphatase [Calditrichota bacterium]MCB9058189.1 serine/threonine-protein phosphatase [Calditrichia bacterium]
MNQEDYILTRDSIFSSYEIEIFNRYGLDSLLDKIIYHYSELTEKKQNLEKKLDDVYQDLSNASAAQINLLPKRINFASELDFCARFIPSQYVSGDTYNVFRLDEDNIGIYQIDISGHGVAAALFSVSLSQMLNANITNRNLLKTVLSEPPYYEINSPDKVLALLNEEKFFDRYEIYFTMIYMIINIRTGAVQFSRAGHNPPFILRTDGGIEQPMDGGLPIGWDFKRHDPVIKLKLNPGDRIFLFSDGICEAANSKRDLFGEKRLAEVFKKNLPSTLDETLNATIRELSTFTGHLKFQDDISIIGMTYLG